ncbi:transposase family protein [Petroclostridium xylanilyticum]|uniref:transposase family protein n=1 Tax=Petroclostridium xylanilyticum TaxID=1792311 RepID=UPI0012FFA1FB|nr:transposase family protein [Petroclostridium xylanilyticum]
MNTNYDIIRKLIGLQGIEVIYSNVNNDIFEVFAISAFDFAVCPHCGRITYTVHDKRYQAYKHLPIWGMDTVIMLEKKRMSAIVTQNIHLMNTLLLSENISVILLPMSNISLR